jgi:hypothetical protein
MTDSMSTIGEPPPTGIDASEAGIAGPVPRRPTRTERGIIFRRTSLRRAIAEGVTIFLLGRLLAMVPLAFWPPALFPLVLVAQLVLTFSPPVWAALRVVSTRREKMSRRFWWLGPQLAALCVAVDVAVSLALGDARPFGGPAGPPDALRLIQGGPEHLMLLSFALDKLLWLGILAIYFTIAVVCTRLANGGFLRFTMPAGKGRVTL